MFKTLKKVFLQALVALTLASASFSHDCGNNCYTCFGKNYCFTCYKSKPVTGPGGNGQVCSSTPPPAKDHCLIYASQLDLPEMPTGLGKKLRPGPPNPYIIPYFLFL